MKRAAIGLAGVAAALLAWEIAASYLLIYFGRWTWAQFGDDLDYPFLAYITFLTNDPTKWTKTLLAAAGTLPVIAAGGLAGMVWYGRVRSNFRRRFVRWPWQTERLPERRGVTDNHGHAEWMTPAQAFGFFGRPRHGKVVGRLADGQLLIDDCTKLNGVSIEFAAPGGGKTSHAITTAARWKGPVFVHDPKCEMGPMMWQYFEAIGRRVIFVSPETTPHDPVTGEIYPWAHLVKRFNALDWIDATGNKAGMQIAALVACFFEEHVAKTDAGDYFRKAASGLIECVLAHFMVADPQTTLATMRTCITLSPDKLRKLIIAIHASSPSQRARELAGPLAGEEFSEKQFGGIHDEANQATKWLSYENLGDMVSGDDFRTIDLIDDDAVIFLQIPLNSLIHQPGCARVIVGAFLNTVLAQEGVCPWSLFLLDEAWLLGRMKGLEVALFAARAYHVAMHMMWQSVAQMEEVWKRDGLRYWIDSATWVAYSSVADIEVAERISRSMGTHAVLASSEGDNTGTRFAGTGQRGRNISWHEIKKPLKDAAGVMTDFERDDLIVMVRGKPLLAKRALWWDQPELAHSIERSRFDLAA